jgi:YD repeat-containing protein
MKKTTVLLVLGLMAAGACRKNEQPPLLSPPPRQDKICRLTQEKNADGIRTTYVLDTNGNMMESRSVTASGSLIRVSVFDYTDGILSAITYFYDEEKTHPEIKITYKREGDKVIISEYKYFDASQEFVETSRRVQIVDANDHLVKEEIYDQNGDRMRLSITIDYQTDARGNITMLRWQGSGNVISTWTYEYDNNPNWKLGHQAYTVMKVSPNNVVRQVNWDENSKVLHEFNSTYEYNAEGYPVSTSDGEAFTYACRDK